MICENIKQLVSYGVNKGLVEPEDVVDTRNQLLEALGLDTYEESDSECESKREDISDEVDESGVNGSGVNKSGVNGSEVNGSRAVEGADVKAGSSLEEILQGILEYACQEGLTPDSITHRDLFDTKIMGKLTPKPSVVIRKFNEHYHQSPQKATDYFYQLSQDSDYIRCYRVKKDMKWQVDTRYGIMDITINLSKPEKDPREIAAARNARQGGYPKCLLCRENEGYAGRINHPARQNHRIVPITIQKSSWGFQYSPYVYYNEHCIVFNMQHIPMKIEKGTFYKLLDFVQQFPHYFVGANADLPIVGGSILSHDHFQGGCYEFAMARALLNKTFVIPGFEDVQAGIVNWPMSVIRISNADPGRLIALADSILTKWRAYSDEAAFIFSEADGEPHNTITPIARKRGERYELELVLRNNITTEECPLGVYHPHNELHHIKKENIGLIEVMGLAVLPARLKDEMERLAQAILQNEDIYSIEEIAHHAVWADDILARYDQIDERNVHEILQKEIGKVFEQVLEDAGVFKQDEAGQAAFMRFVSTL